ncbi:MULTISPECIES: hypothetical protein [unclassified Streptomyces]|nr:MULTISPECIES: hypothetical protein [unclassified Streptomyces]
MACTDTHCEDGLVPNRNSDDPEDVTLCPTCHPGYPELNYSEDYA